MEVEEARNKNSDRKNKKKKKKSKSHNNSNSNQISKQLNGNVNQLLDASDASVMAKYQAAGIIANAALLKVLSACRPGVRVVDLCVMGDELIVSECNKVYPELKISGQKGIAFPTCVAVNEVAGHYSPYSGDTRTIHAEDMVKVDLAVHLDGFCAVVAHTICLGKCQKQKANVVAAAWTGAQSALRMLKPGNTNSQVTYAISKSAAAFKCEPMDCVLSHEMRQYVIDHDRTIISKETAERKVEEFGVEAFQVFGLDVMMSSGRGKAIERGERCTVYKRNVEVDYPLKLKTSAELLRQIDHQYPTFPFTMRYFQDNRCRLGVCECAKHHLLQSYPILSEKPGVSVAHFKYTVIAHPDGPVQITGLPLDMGTVHPDFQIEDDELRNLLSLPFSGKLPRLYDAVPVLSQQELALADANASAAAAAGMPVESGSRNSTKKNSNSNNGNGNKNKNKNKSKNKNKNKNKKQNQKGRKAKNNKSKNAKNRKGQNPRSKNSKKNQNRPAANKNKKKAGMDLD